MQNQMKFIPNKLDFQKFISPNLLIKSHNNLQRDSQLPNFNNSTDFFTRAYRVRILMKRAKSIAHV